jgi:hypothetical protein
MASTIRRFQISSDTFAIKNGWLQLEGPSIRVDSITSLSVVRNRDDISREYEARNNLERKETSKRKPLGTILFIFSIASEIALLFMIPVEISKAINGWIALNIEPHFQELKVFIHNLGVIAMIIAFILYVLISFSVLIFFVSLFFIVAGWVRERGIYLIYGSHRIYSHNNIYEFAIDTNSSMEFFFLSKDINYLYRIKEAIEEAIRSKDSSVSYYFNISSQTIEKIHANTHNVIGSPGAAIIGDNASHVHQTTNVSIQGIQDIAQLSALVEQSNAPNKALMQECLDIVRSHLADGSSKAQAKTAWETFLANVGALAKAGGDIWNLVSRVATLVG